MSVPITRVSRWAFTWATALAFLLGFFISVPEARATSGTMLITNDTTLTEDHQGTIVIASDGVTLDCAGHAVIGPGFFGISLSGRHGVTVKNCVVDGFNQDIILTESSSNAIVDNRVRGGVFQGIALFSSSDNHLARNNASDNSSDAQGILLFDHSDRNVIVDNTANRNLQGLRVDAGSGANRLAGNIANNNAVFGFSIEGGSSANIVESNVFSGNHIFGGFVFNSAGTVIRANHVAFTGQLGIALNGATDGAVSGNTFVRNGDTGLQLFLSTANAVGSNRFVNNGRDGLDLTMSDSNRVEKNHSVGNAESGFVVQSSNRNVFTENGAFRNGAVGFNVFGASELNAFTKNVACANQVDALDASVGGAGNAWSDNRFCISSGVG
jgi:parallel beta-helix repeat protein